jgi:integrase
MTHSNRLRFTTRSIEHLPPGPADAASKAIEYSDAEIPGFKLAVSKTHRKTFMLRYTFHERKRAVRIGEYPATDLSEARKIALEMRGLLDRDIDPQTSRDRVKGSPTLSIFAEDYLAYAKQHKRSWRDDESKLRMYILPRFGNRRLCDIGRRDVELFIGEMRRTRTPATANRFLCLLSAMFRRAVLWERTERNPCSGMQRFKENNQQQRFLTPDELGRLFAAMDQAPETARVPVAAIQMLLLTGARRREITNMRWRDVDFDRKVAFIPTSKSGKSKYLQLNDAALEVLGNLPTRGNSEWVFAGRADPTKPLNDPRKTFWKLLRQAGIHDHVRLHDCRHTFAATVINSGHENANLYTVQSLLFHSSPSVTMRYAHIASGTLRNASQAAADVMTQARVAASDAVDHQVAEEPAIVP